MVGGFSIFTLMPRRRVGVSSTIADMCSSPTLVVEEDEVAQDPLEYLYEEAEVCST